jgi:REP element-mobilizing transposase RayT
MRYIFCVLGVAELRLRDGGSARLQPGESGAKGCGFSRRGMDFPERIFFVTTVTASRNMLFRSERAARLFLDVLFRYRDDGKFQLYEFVVMPDHVHLILEPKPALERAMQLIKGGYSFRYKKEMRSSGEIWSAVSRIIAFAIGTTTRSIAGIFIGIL